MDFQGSHKYAAPPQQVWNALMNPAVLKECIPGAQEVKIVGNSAIEATIHISAPIINGTFTGTAQIVSQNPPSQIVLGIDRSGSYGSIKGQATIDLAADGAGTNLTYTAHVDLSGKVSMGDNMIGQQLAKGGLGQFFKNLESKV